MDVTSTLKNEIFRPLTSIIIPGFFAIIPFVFVIIFYFPKTIIFAKDYQIFFGFSIFACATAAGLVLEDIGGQIESLWDCILDKRYPSRKRCWYKYLKLQIQDEYIGQRYLRTVHMRFKFELSMIPSLILFLLGLLWANHLYIIWNSKTATYIAVSILFITVYIAYESYDSAYVLGSCHQAITTAVRLAQKQKQNTAIANPNA